MLMKLNLQLFADGEDDLDLDSMLEEFNNEWPDEEVEETSTETAEETETVEEAEEETESEDVSHETKEDKPLESDEEKRNKAFAELRRERDEAKRFADFIKRMADDNGVAPEDILKRYDEKRLEVQAEKDGVPLDVLKRINALETENKEVKEREAAARLDAQIQSVMTKYNADDNAIKATFEEMFKAGVDPRTSSNVDFEKFYKAANFDSIVQAEIEKARQADLANKKKRQTDAVPPNGNSVTQSDGDLSDEEVDSILAKMDIKI